MNFLDLFLEYTQEQESPTSFWWWSGLSALSTVMRDNVYLQLGPMKIFPNMYIMILADSAVARKGFPPQVAHDFLKAIDNTKVIAGRSTIQGVITELGSTETNKLGILSKRGATALYYSGEFAASFVNDLAVVNILTDLYDYHVEYPVRLKDSLTILQNVCFGMLVATNQTMLDQLYDGRAHQGGLLGRTFVVYEKTRRRKNSLVYSEDFDPEKKKRLLEHLRKLSQVHCIAQLDEKAKKHYHEWYNSIDDTIVDKTGFLHRCHNGVLKIALSLAAADSDIIKTNPLIINYEHIALAIEAVFLIKTNHDRITLSQGLSQNKNQVALLIKALTEAKHYQLTRQQILQKHFTDFGTTELNMIIETLEAGGIIKTVGILKEVGYQLTPSAIERFVKYKHHEEKSKKIQTA